jgi:membrane fusion protein (multidrug efflux system)
MSWQLFWLLGFTGCAGDMVESSVPTGPVAVPVQIWRAEASLLGRRSSWTGVVRGREQAFVLSETPGRVTSLVVAVGDQVGVGATLVRLEDGRQTIGVQAAQATLARALVAEQAATRQRDRTLALGDAVSLAKREDADTAVELARADRQAARVQLKARQRDLSDTRVRAPFSGEVTRLHVDLGQVLGVGTPVATVVDTRELRVRIGVPTRELSEIAVGAQALVAGNDCQVARVDRQVDPVTGLVQVEVACDADPNWLIGAPVQVELVLGDGEPVLAVPSAAVIDRYGEAQIYVIVDGIAQARSVQLGPRTDTHRQIVAGLKPGEQVVVRGVERLTDGVRVQVR